MFLRWKSSLDGHQPSGEAQVHPVAPCLECSTSTRPSLPVSSELAGRDGCIVSAMESLAQIQRQEAPPEQLVPPLNIQNVRELTGEEVAVESNPLRSQSSNDKTIYHLLSMFGLVGVEALSCVILPSARESIDL